MCCQEGQMIEWGGVLWPWWLMDPAEAGGLWRVKSFFKKCQETCEKKIKCRGSGSHCTIFIVRGATAAGEMCKSAKKKSACHPWQKRTAK